jgi:hypothetical protein
MIRDDPVGGIAAGSQIASGAWLKQYRLRLSFTHLFHMKPLFP